MHYQAESDTCRPKLAEAASEREGGRDEGAEIWLFASLLFCGLVTRHNFA